MLKEVSRIPAEGVETREGATSAMFGLAPGHLMVSLDPGGDPLGDEAVRLCAAAGARTLRPPGAAADARMSMITSLPGVGRALGRARAGRGPRRRQADLDRRLLRDRAERDVSVRLGVVGLGSVFWTPYMSLIERLQGQGRVEVTAVYDAEPRQARRRRRAARAEPGPAVGRRRLHATTTSTPS